MKMATSGWFIVNCLWVLAKIDSSDWSSCDYFKEDGSDNGYTSFIRNHFDWHVMFVGQYSVGDISYEGLKSVNNAHGQGYSLDLFIQTIWSNYDIIYIAIILFKDCIGRRLKILVMEFRIISKIPYSSTTQPMVFMVSYIHFFPENNVHLGLISSSGALYDIQSYFRWLKSAKEWKTSLMQGVLSMVEWEQSQLLSRGFVLMLFIH